MAGLILGGFPYNDRSVIDNDVNQSILASVVLLTVRSSICTHRRRAREPCAQGRRRLLRVGTLWNLETGVELEWSGTPAGRCRLRDQFLWRGCARRLGCAGFEVAILWAAGAAPT